MPGLFTFFLGVVSNRFEKQVTSSVEHCYFTAEPHVVSKTSHQLLLVANKDVLPALQNSNVIYQFSFHCDSRYVGRTSQKLQDRIKQHVPKSIRYGTSSPKRDLPIGKCKYSTKSTTQMQSLTHDSAIGSHLLRNPICAQHYDDSMFSILAKGLSPFHLSAFEATFIQTFNSIFCRQKEFVYNLKILHISAGFVNLLRTASLSRPLILCQSHLGSFYKYSAFFVLYILKILANNCAHGGGRVVSASGSETSVWSSTPASAIIYDAYTFIIKKKNCFS